MKKLFVLCAVAPLCAMEQPAPVEKSQKASPEQIYKSLWLNYKDQLPLVAEGHLALGDVVVMIGKICVEVEQRNPAEAIKWLMRFKSRVEIDYTWLSAEQNEVCDLLYSELHDKVMTTQPDDVKKMLPTEFTDQFELPAQKWLRKIVENNMCTGLEWTGFLAHPDFKTTMNTPNTPEKLKEARLKQINAFETQK